MKRKSAIILVLALVLCLVLSLPAFANAAEPPRSVILVQNPPPDFELYIQVPDGEPQLLPKIKKGWETQYQIASDLDGAVLLAVYDGQEVRVAVPLLVSPYKEVLTLDLEAKTLTIGQVPWRVPALIALRVTLTLVIEGVVFYLFGYRERKSWKAFVLINLVTQGFLNAMLTGPVISHYWMIGFLFLEGLVLVAEVLAFSALTEDHHSARYAVTANIASLVMGGLFISYLPI